MLTFVAKRLGAAVVLMFAITAATFLMMYGNGPAIARAILGTESSSSDQVEAKMVELGLDQPVLNQYGEWLATLLSGGGLGRSFYSGESVNHMLSDRMPVTLSVLAFGLLLTAVISVVIGVVAAVRGGWIDRGLQIFAVMGYAVPSFIVAITLIIAFAVTIRIFPATGFISPSVSVSKWLASLTLPVIAVVVGTIGAIAQQFRGTVSDVLRQDFVRTLRSRGISERAIVARHVLRNAAGPGLIILGLQTVALFGAAVIIEQVFALAGIGNLTVSASLAGDIPVVMGCVVFAVGLVVIVNTFTDIANGWLNPKVRK